MEDKPWRTFSQFESVKIEDQSQTIVEQLDEAEQWIIVNRMHFVHGLDFEKQALIDEPATTLPPSPPELIQ